ncbi:MAG: hypothetical protein Q7J58_05410 [Hydrogenophaga sp.]|jgi:hypothetical protein|uniref:DUF6920 family protein n=1 Tax=Hydrogenophaga sp. TaxID=1904254 RepID=UPI00272200AA|nr:DUF6544 family protein [Hydrogenophaga sp.]MDO9568805.1 hypothetical protein [Hydrogenophaga sp.]
MTWLIWLFLIVAALALIFVGLNVVGAMRWTGATQAILARLEAKRLPASPARYDPREIEGLPAPVQRYFSTVLTPGQSIVTAATLEHAGRFNLSPTGEQWKPFTSRQRVVVQRPGFLWDARIALVPGVSVRVHDSYSDGEGLLHAAVHGLFSVARLQGGGELARGELMRFFAEAAWYPTALLPSQGVRWAAVDERSASATLTDGPLSITLLFRFDESGHMASVFAQARGRVVGQETSLAPWEGTWSNHQRVEGMTVPLTGEVAWLLPEGRKTYWRGTVTSLNFDWSL